MYLTSSGNANEQAQTRACQGQMRRSVYTVTVSASRWKVCSSARILLLLIDKYLSAGLRQLKPSLDEAGEDRDGLNSLE